MVKDDHFDLDMDSLFGGQEDQWWLNTGEEEEEEQRKEATRRSWRFLSPSAGAKYTKLIESEDVEEDIRWLSNVASKERPILTMLRATGYSMAQTSYCFVSRYRWQLLKTLLWILAIVAVALLLVQNNNLNRDMDELRRRHNSFNDQNQTDQLRIQAEEIENLHAELTRIESDQEQKLQTKIDEQMTKFESDQEQKLQTKIDEQMMKFESDQEQKLQTKIDEKMTKIESDQEQKLQTKIDEQMNMLHSQDEKIEFLQREIAGIKLGQLPELYQISSKTDQLQQRMNRVEASSRSVCSHEPDHSRIFDRLDDVERKAEDNSKTWYQRLRSYFSG